MNSLATTEFDRLKNTELFAKTGVKDTDAANVVSSWKDAIEHCRSREWDDWILDARNQISDKVRAAAPARYEEWNDIAHEVRRDVMPHVERVCAAVAKAYGLPVRFWHVVQWDVMHFFIEVAYSDIALPGFFHSQWEWYMRGHFPCGWEGQYPAGRAIIY